MLPVSLWPPPVSRCKHSLICFRVAEPGRWPRDLKYRAVGKGDEDRGHAAVPNGGGVRGPSYGRMTLTPTL